MNITPAKQAALDRLHASRRGKPVHPEPPPELAQLARLMDAASQLFTLRGNPISCRKVGKMLGVHERTARRWLSGKARPALGYHAAIRRAARQAATAIEALKREKRKSGK